MLGFRLLCPARWTVRPDSLNIVIDNYAAREGTRMEAADATTNAETKAQTHEVSILMKTFNYLLGNMLGEMILKH